MSRTSFFWIVLACLFAVSCSRPTEPEAAAKAGGAEPDPAAGPRIVRLSADSAGSAGVRVGVAEPTEAGERIEVAGRVTLDEDHTARVGSFVEGVVLSCCKSVGSYVRKGDVLAQVHSHGTHEIVAEYLTTQAELRGAQSELEYARQAHGRAAKLLELKAGSLQAVQRAETDVRAAEAAVAAGEAAVQRAKAHLDFYGLDPEAVENPKAGEEPHIDIAAPMSGTIVERSVKLGDVVTPSTEMYVLSDLSRLWVIAQVPEERLGALHAGMRVEVRTRAFPDRGFPGRVTQVASELDPETMTVQVRCSVPNPGGSLKTGMYATVRLVSETLQSMLVVPEAAIQRIDDEPVVFIARSGDAFEVRRVREGRRIGDRIEIVEGLRAGERLAVSGAFVLKSELLKSELEGDE
jgi:multidrug efflux pump subunit AcrA (membrane-fusion protein)